MSRELRRAIPVKVRSIAGGRRSQPDKPYSACYAPTVQMYFQPDGDVRACCRNMSYPLGNVGQQRLTEIWEGARRRELVTRLAVDDYSHGCEGCQWEIETEGREGSYPESFTEFAGYLTHEPEVAEWPHFLEFNLSNSCNLQCIQCNGDLSSSIRIHREGRPPQPKVYGDEFFDDLRLFLPHLEAAQFAGGEPFLGAENFRVWDLVAEVAPDLRCQVVTNATQWNKRVEAVLEKVRVSPTFSIDGITRETYEAIRIDSDHALVMANIDRFCAYAERVGTDVFINFCLMAQNYHEFGDLLLFAEARGIYVNVSVVHYPEHCSIARLDPAEIAAIHRSMVADSDRVLAGLSRHRSTWQREVERIGSWRHQAETPTDHDVLWGIVDKGPFTFDRWADRTPDDGAARAALAAFATDGMVHELLIGVGEAIIECPAATAAALDVEPEALMGQPVSLLQTIAERLYGPLSEQVLLAESDDQVDAESVFGGMVFRTSIVAIRDQTGFADQARLLFASQPMSAESGG